MGWANGHKQYKHKDSVQCLVWFHLCPGAGDSEDTPGADWAHPPATRGQSLDTEMVGININHWGHYTSLIASYPQVPCHCTIQRYRCNISSIKWSTFYGVHDACCRDHIFNFGNLIIIRLKPVLEFPSNFSLAVAECLKFLTSSPIWRVGEWLFGFDATRSGGVRRLGLVILEK